MMGFAQPGEGPQSSGSRWYERMEHDAGPGAIGLNQMPPWCQSQRRRISRFKLEIRSHLLRGETIRDTFEMQNIMHLLCYKNLKTLK